MDRYALTHLADATLLHDVKRHLGDERRSIALVLAHIAEIDERRLYLPAAYDSMHAWCMGELHLSEDAACDRIRVARVAREFPVIYEMVADGRLHLGAVRLLARYVRPETVDGLLAAATHRSKAEIALMLAERFPRTDVLSLEQEGPAAASVEPEPSNGPVTLSVPERIAISLDPCATPGQRRSRVEPLSADSVAVQFTMARATHEKLKRVRELLGHALPSADIADVFDRALGALIARLEKRKFAVTSKPREGRTSTNPDSRHIPAHVKREVWARDGGRCTYVSESGKLCNSQHQLEYDHVHEFARGGEETVDNIRLRCRPHNQHTAEQSFGKEFMERKREAAREEAARRRSEADAQDHARERAEEVIPWLRQLGFSAGEAKRAAACCTAIPDASLEERVRFALKRPRPESGLGGADVPLG